MQTRVYRKRSDADRDPTYILLMWVRMGEETPMLKKMLLLMLLTHLSPIGVKSNTFVKIVTCPPPPKISANLNSVHTEIKTFSDLPENVIRYLEEKIIPHC